jgi:oxygen-dependent protoporphyrinogen oxidase
VTNGHTHVTVIGAGLSGLAAAWYLARAGASVHVVEAADRPGGLIQTHHVPEGMVETAARAFTWSDRVADLFQAANVQPCLPQEQSKRRYIFRDGRPMRWPLTVAETMGLAARFGRSWVTRTARPRADESVTTWGTRVLGPSALNWLLAPALQGIYASPPDALSAPALFGKKRIKRGKLAAPPDGMSELIERLHAALKAKGVTFKFGHTATVIDTSAPTVICTNAPAAARLLASQAPEVAAALGRIRMVSLVTVTAFFAPHQDDLRGFGVLFPRGTGVDALGALFNTEIFAGRGQLRSETWIYGGLSPAGLPKGDDDIARRLAADRAVLTNRSDGPRAFYATSQVDALPVYDSAVLDADAALKHLPPTVAVAGNYCGRIGVSSLLDGAAAAAAQLCHVGPAA